MSVENVSATAAGGVRGIQSQLPIFNLVFSARALCFIGNSARRFLADMSIAISHLGDTKVRQSTPTSISFHSLYTDSRTSRQTHA